MEMNYLASSNNPNRLDGPMYGQDELLILLALRQPQQARRAS